MSNLSRPSTKVFLLALVALLSSFAAGERARNGPLPNAAERHSQPVATDIVGVPSVAEVMKLLRTSSALGEDLQARARRRRDSENEPSQTLDPGYRVAAFREALPPGFGRAYNSSNKMGCYFFAIRQTILAHARVHYAVLTIFRRCKSGGTHAPGGVNISLVADTSASSPGAAPRDAVNMSCAGRNGGDWLRIIVTPFVQRWAAGDNHRSICLLSRRSGRAPRMSLYSLQGGNLKAGKNRNASLTVIYEPKVLGDQPTCTPTSDYEMAARTHAPTCCRKPYFVDFMATRWRSNILFPSGYDAYTCHGWCPRESPPSSDQVSTREVSHWFSLVHRQCQPTRYSSVTIMMQGDGGRLLLQSVPNAVVLACGCGKHSQKAGRG